VINISLNSKLTGIISLIESSKCWIYNYSFSGFWLFFNL